MFITTLACNQLKITLQFRHIPAKKDGVPESNVAENITAIRLSQIAEIISPAG